MLSCSHSFTPQITWRDRFEIRRRKDVIAHARQSGTTFGGIDNRVEELGYKAIPTVSAVAPPGGLVDYDFYVEIRAALIAQARQEIYDAIALELHGAMATTGQRTT
ncbi:MULTISPECIES: M81 family metallopeptidase [Mesorhizobium]|uniref:M81 family metallopeptidase n=1 Tax=Mesorhizobium australicum TaxID=536018 RepID=UPI00333A3735